MRAREEISDGKYVAFKVDDFYKFCVQFHKAWSEPGPTDVRIEDIAAPFVILDHTVIRDQDMMAASTLDSYADACLLVSEIIGQAGLPESPQMVDHLVRQSEFFRGRALRARSSETKKIPD